MHMGMANLDFKVVDHWLEAFVSKSIDPGVFLWLFHPYEILDLEESVISSELVQVLRSHLERCISEYEVTFVNMEECIVQTQV